MNDALRDAREKLKNITPLKTDCGRICGAKCCRSLEGEETGMLLFPGEEKYYRDKPGWEIRKAETGKLLICAGECERDERPLACRMFPLLPLLRNGDIKTAVDLRAKAVCPLARQGIRAMDPAFRAAVKEAGETLLAEEAQAGFLRRMTEAQGEIREWRERLGGGGV